MSSQQESRLQRTVRAILGLRPARLTHPAQWLARAAALVQALIEDRRRYLRFSPDPVHDSWISRCEPGHAQAAVERFEQAGRTERNIAVVMPVAHEPLHWIWASLRSVRRQTVAPCDIRLVCTRRCPAGRRRLISMLACLAPGTRAAAGTSWSGAVSAATQWVLPLWPGDRLPPRALDTYRSAAAEFPESVLLYGDEDTYDPASGARRAPVLKPGWAPVTLLASDTVGHAVCLRRDCVPMTDIASIGDTPLPIFRISLAHARANGNGRHIPEFLLHRHPTAIPTDRDKSADSMIIKHLEQMGASGARCSRAPSGARRVTWRPQHWPSVSVIVVDDSPAHSRLVRAIEQLRMRTDYPDWDIAVCRTTPMGARVQHWATEMRDALRVVVSDNGESLARALSRLVESARGECVLFLDPRVEPLHKNWLRELAAWSQLPGVGAVGPLILDADGRIQSAGIAAGLGLLYGHLYEGESEDGPASFGHVDVTRDVTAVSLAALLVPRAAFRDAQGFPPKPVDTYLDIALCDRLRAFGRHVICVPTARMRRDVAVMEHSHEDVQSLTGMLERRSGLTDAFLHPRLSVRDPVLTVQPADALPAGAVIAQQIKAVRAACRPFEPLKPSNAATPGTSTGYRVRQLLDARWDLRFFFPLAALPWGQSGFVHWMKTQCDDLDITAVELEAFLTETALNPGEELALTWQRMPEWQHRHPDGLTSRGLPALLDWIARVYRVPRTELDELQVPLAAKESARAATETQGVNILAHLCLPCGVEQAARTCMAALRSSGYRISARDLPAAPSGDSPDRRRWPGTEVHPVSIFFVQPEFALEDWLSRSRLYPGKDTYRIGNWYWEFPEVPDSWGRHAIDFDETWAASRFLETAFREALPIPVTYMPPGLAIDFTPRSRSFFELPDDRFIFLFVFDAGSSMERKNPRGLIDAFRRAVRADDNALLVVKTSRGSRHPEDMAALMDYADGLNVHFMDVTLARNEVLALINTCDCYVSLHRSEGLGLPLAEAMLMGKPVIATAYSGNLDFMTPGNSLLVDARQVQVEQDWGPYKAGWTWADPDVEHAAARMRSVLDNREATAATARRGQTDARRHFDMDTYTERMITRLHNIRATL